MADDDRSLVRAASPSVMDARDGTWLVAPNGDVCFVEGDSADVVRAILAFTGSQRTRDAIAAHVIELANGDDGARKTIDEAIALLERFGALVSPRAVAQTRPAVQRLSGGRVVLCVTGAIGALHAPLLVERLLRDGRDVRVAMTRSARRFVAARGFEAITHRAVAKSMWTGKPSAPSPHIDLAQWADVVAIAPCTATTLARVANGDCSELVPAIATATRAPVLLAPSMNAAMLGSAVVSASIARAREAGFFVALAGHGLEVADAPSERAPRAGGGAGAEHVARFVSILLERAVSDAPKLATRAEWDAEHARGDAADDSAEDDDLLAALDDGAMHAKPCLRVLEIGAGTGANARAAARRGHVVVATDFSESAIARAHDLDPEDTVTWMVDDATDSRVRGTFDVVVDRACFGCVPLARRARYVASVASHLRAGGAWLVKVLAAPSRDVRAHAFTRDEAIAIGGDAFDVASARESVLRFGGAGERPAWMLVLRRR
jgi:SAM-dependent methyltransferase